ncbi:MAG TPA: DNRLRE domain-containing protein, partial [Chloroflexi bacterium]|nr:DNRLRE domain-containing protein [Chloroflexota bacterium]
RARTYLHFPLDVFPPGTEIVRVTLHAYVDGSSNLGETKLGVYRVLESWQEDGWESDPATWPALLTSPIAVTTVRLTVITPTVPVTIPTSTPVPTPTPTVTSTPTPTVGASPPATTTPSSPLPTPTQSRPLGPAIPLQQTAKMWISWDVTVLVRAWLEGESPDDGLALASAPDPNASPEVAGNLLVARWLEVGDFNTRPYLIAEYILQPVTPTPTQPASPLASPTAVPVLPPAGSAARDEFWGLVLLGVLLLLVGLSQLRDEKIVSRSGDGT